MKKAAVCLVVLTLFGTGFLAGGWYRQREVVGATSALGRKVLYYVDPMHPGYTSDKPGVAPDCGMRLEPVYEDEPADARRTRGSRVGDGIVHVSPDKQQLIGVRLAGVERSAITEPLHLYGRVVADENRSYTIDVGIDGYIRDLSPVTTGSLVRKDQWLATYSAVDLRAALQGFVVALEIADRSKRAAAPPPQIEMENANLQQNRDRLLTYGISRTQLDEIARTKVVPTDLTITAPGDGFVLSRNVSIGQKIRRGDQLYRIADLRRIWILVEIVGPEADHVRPGTTVNVSVPGRNVSRTARVTTAVLPQFDPATQAAVVRVEADNPDYVLRPDMFVDVDLPIALPSAIAVPLDAIVDSGRDQMVFVDRGGTFEARRVRTGWRLGGRVEILEGLREGERVVVSGAFLLDAETRITHAIPASGSSR